MDHADPEEELLIDLSNTPVSEPDYLTVTLTRSSAEERWGFLTYNHRFPLTVGKVDDRLSNVLQKGDVVVSINGVVLESFESAAVLIRHAQEKMVLAIDRPHSAENGGHVDVKVAASTTVASSNGLSSNTNKATGANGENGSLLIAHACVAVAPSARLTEKPQKLSVDAVLLAATRSNVDAVLVHLPKPPRVALYNVQNCPLGEKEGFTGEFHQYLQQFLSQQALQAGSANKDVRFDAVTAAIGSGIARLPGELIKEISTKGSDTVKRQEATACSSYERERFVSQLNAICSVVQSCKRAREERKEELAAATRQRKAALRESLKAYQLLYSDADDTSVLTGTASIKATSFAFARQAAMAQPAISGLQITTLPTPQVNLSIQPSSNPGPLHQMLPPPPYTQQRKKRERRRKRGDALQAPSGTGVLPQPFQ